MFNIADGLILLIILISTLISWMRGFTREILSLAAWVGAFLVAFSFSHQLGDNFANYVHTPLIRTASAFTLLFLVTFILISLVNFCIHLLINRAGLSGFDRLCGLFVGAARGILLVGLILLLVKLTPIVDNPSWQNSFLIAKFEPVENWLKSFMPEYIEKHTIMTD